MSLEAGRLNKRVVLQSPTLTQNTTTGEMALSWNTEATVWAAVEAISVKEYIAAQATQSQIDTRVTIRYRADVLATWRLTHRGKVYNIHGPLPDKDSGLEYMTLPCSTGVDDGQ